MKIGIIGSSQISDRFCQTVNHLISNHAQIRLEANYSRDLLKAQTFALKHNIKFSFDNKLELLNTVDIVYIATPNSCHYEDVKLSLEHGCHVLVEKPMTISSLQTNELFELAKTNKLVLMEAIKTCSMNTYRHLQANIEKIGELKTFDLNMMRAYGNFPQPGAENIPNIYRKQMDGGVCADLGSYALFPLIDFIYPQFTAEQILIQTTKNNTHLDVDINISAEVSCRLNQVAGRITLAMNCQDDRLSTITGSNGFVTIDSLSQFNTICYYNHNHQLIEKVVRSDEPLMTSELKTMLHMVATNQKSSPTHDPSKSIKVAKLIETLQK